MGFDISFAGSIGVSEKPSWCGSFPDEIQEILITNCTSSASIELAVVSFDRFVRNMIFPCDISQSDLQNVLVSVMISNETAHMGTVKVFSREADTNENTIKFRIAYQFVGQYYYSSPTNWYLPVIISVEAPILVSVSTFQEGSINGVSTTHYDYPPSHLSEEQGIFINISSVASFRLKYKNNTSDAIEIPTVVDMSVLYNDVLTAVHDICGSDLNVHELFEEIVLTNDTLWVEFLVLFRVGVIPDLITVDSATSPDVAFVFVLITADNLMLHFFNNFYVNATHTSRNENNYGKANTNSGFYNCYQRKNNYITWSYDTGYSDEGVLAEVIVIWPH